MFVHSRALTASEIGQTIRQRRKQLGFTLSDIEEATCISKKTIIKIEMGGDAKFSTITTLLSILGLSLEFSEQNQKDINSDKEESNVWI